MENLVEKKLKSLIYSPATIKLPESRDLLRSHAIFADLEPKKFEAAVWPNVKLQVGT